METEHTALDSFWLAPHPLSHAVKCWRWPFRANYIISANWLWTSIATAESENLWSSPLLQHFMSASFTPLWRKLSTVPKNILIDMCGKQVAKYGLESLGKNLTELIGDDHLNKAVETMTECRLVQFLYNHGKFDTEITINGTCLVRFQTKTRVLSVWPGRNVLGGEHN